MTEKYSKHEMDEIEMFKKEVKNCHESLYGAYKRIKELVEEVAVLNQKVVELRLQVNKEVSTITAWADSENPDALHTEKGNGKQLDLEDYLKDKKDDD